MRSEIFFRRIGWLLCVIFLLAGFSIAYRLVIRALQYKEGNMRGPYYGTPCITNRFDPKADSIRLGQKHILELHQADTNENPNLILRDIETGGVKWCQTLAPIQSHDDGTSKAYRIYWMKFRRIVKEDSLTIIHVYCDWENGGKEAGIIYLDKQGSFQHFKLDW